jgi:hypothetical protein
MVDHALACHRPAAETSCGGDQAVRLGLGSKTPACLALAWFASLILQVFPLRSTVRRSAPHCERHEPPVARFDQIEGIKGLADQRADPEG